MGTKFVDGDDKMLVPGPETAWIVQRIFEMRAEGAKWTAIQHWLEAEGIANPSGGPVWTTGTLSSLVKNRRYLGEVQIGDVAPTRDAHEALVSSDVFAAAQPGSPLPRTGKNVAGIAGLGLLVCQSCGRPCSVGGTTGRQAFYTCRRTWSGGRCPEPMMGKQANIDAAVDAALRAVADGDHEAVDAARLQRDVSDARAELKVARKALKRFVEAFDDDDDLDVVRRQKAEHRARIAEAQERVEAAEAAAEGVADFPTSAKAWDALTLAGRQRAARNVIAGVVLGPRTTYSKKLSDSADRIRIVWR